MANRRKLFVSDSVRTVAAGLAAFIAVGVVVFGVLYGVVYLWSMSNVWADLLYMYTEPIAIAVGLVSAGYVVAKIAHRAPFIHSASLVALLALVHAAYRRWGPETLSDDLVPAIVSTFGPHITTRERLYLLRFFSLRLCSYVCRSPCWAPGLAFVSGEDGRARKRRISSALRGVASGPFKY